MAAEVQGVKETAKALRRIDPELRKEFNREVKRIAAPITDTAKAAYADYLIPSGTRRVWTQRERQIYPFTVAKARRGIRTKVDTSRSARSSIKVIQANPAAAIYEFAGAKTDNPLGRAFSSKGRTPARIMWPSAEAKLALVIDEMRDLAKEVEKLVQKELG